MAREYEMMVVLAPEVGADDVPGRMEQLKTLVTEHGGVVSEVIDWGRRRLAYPIKGNFEGHYVITQFSSDNGRGNQQVEAELNIDETILRYLIIRRDG